MTQKQMQGKPADASPTNGDHSNASNQQGDHNVILRRNNRGCKSKDFYNWPELPFDEMESPLAVQQYIQQLIHRDPSDVDKILKLPEGQDLGAWKIEHLRLFCMQLNRLATYLQECCHPETCNQMTATEQWIFLCAAHKQPNECPAIDYTRHTLDGAASLLNSNKYFPSRVTIRENSVAKLGSVCRRIYRIFSHAYYHHFQVFDVFERETHLCKRFSKFVTDYELMSKDSLIVPSDGSKPNLETPPTNQQGLTSSQDTTTVASTTPNTTSTTTPPTTTASTATLAGESASTNEVASQQNPKKSSSTDNNKPASYVDAKNKKLINEIPSSTRQSWSTNTMVKGGSNMNSPKVANMDRKSNKSIEESSTTTAASTTTTASPTATPPSTTAPSPPTATTATTTAAPSTNNTGQERGNDASRNGLESEA